MSDTPVEPLPNPHTTHQPTPGLSPDPLEAEVTGLQVEQQFAHDTLDSAILRLESTLDAEDLDSLTATRDLLAAGGDQAAIETGADDYEKTLYHLTATLDSVDLAALNAVLTSMRFVSNHLRTGAVLPPLPVPEDPAPKSEEVPPEPAQEPQAPPSSF